MIRAGHTQAQAVAASLSNARRHPGHYDYGGSITPGLVPSGATENPLEQNVIQQLSSVPTEKLQELAVSPAANTPQGQIARRLLAQRHIMPQGSPGGGGITGTPINPAQTQGVQPQLPTYQDGGDISWTESARLARPFEHMGTTGFLHSAVPGRTDLINAQPPVGSFVIPADVVSGVGEGNSLAGAALIQHAISMGPYGTPLPPKRTINRMPPPPPRFTEPLMGPAAAAGGKIKKQREDIGKPTPILAAGGEFIVGPHDVTRWGGGDNKRGHDVLDHWVVRKRKEIAHTMLKLPGPKR